MPVPCPHWREIDQGCGQRARPIPVHRAMKPGYQTQKLFFALLPIKIRLTTSSLSSAWRVGLPRERLGAVKRRGLGDKPLSPRCISQDSNELNVRKKFHLLTYKQNCQEFIMVMRTTAARVSEVRATVAYTLSPITHGRLFGLNCICAVRSP